MQMSIRSLFACEGAALGSRGLRVRVAAPATQARPISSAAAATSIWARCIMASETCRERAALVRGCSKRQAGQH